MVRTIVLADCDETCPEWIQIQEELGRYGRFVLTTWAIKGQLRARAMKHRGGSRVPAGLKLDAEEAQELAHAVLVVSLEKFRKKSLRTWDPSGKASLTTYFVGRCLMDLPDVYEKWNANERGRGSDFERWTDDVIAVGPHVRSPDAEVEARLLVDDLFKDDPDLREVLERRVQGWSWNAIAEGRGFGETGEYVKVNTYRATTSLRQELEQLYERDVDAFRSHLMVSRGIHMSEAEDVVNEVFVQVYKAIERGEGRLYERMKDGCCRDIWLRRLFNDELSSRENCERQTRRAEKAYAWRRHRQPYDGTRVDDRQVWRESLAVLPQRQRQAFWLRYYEMLTLKEVATNMGIKVTTVKSHLKRAHRRLDQEARS